MPRMTHSLARDYEADGIGHLTVQPSEIPVSYSDGEMGCLRKCDNAMSLTLAAVRSC